MKPKTKRRKAPCKVVSLLLPPYILTAAWDKLHKKFERGKATECDLVNLRLLDAKLGKP